jgi:ornithine cyclodeaminase/alanine dehydrogenase-like protein (mu-crystallin family)
MYLSESEVREVLRYEALIPAIREALIDYSAGRVEQPARMILRAGNAIGHRNGWFALMPVIYGDVMGVKTVTFYPGNAELGIHTHMAVIELLDRSTGRPLAVMDGRLITEMRTAAVSATAFGALAPLHFDTPPRSFGIIGSGVQARAHVEALRHVWPSLEEIGIWSPTRAHAEKCAADVGGRAVGLDEAAAAEVVLTATLSAEPVLQGRWLRENALVLAVGGIGPANRELDDEVVRSSYVVAESRDCVGRESGDVVGSGAKIAAEIGEILSRTESGTVPKAGRVLFKSVGMAIEDITAARLVWTGRNRATED